MEYFIIFLPLLGAFIAGFFGNKFDQKYSQFITSVFVSVNGVVTDVEIFNSEDSGAPIAKVGIRFKTPRELSGETIHYTVFSDSTKINYSQVSKDTFVFSFGLCVDVFLNTLFSTKLINFFMSSNDALPLFTKKFECFSEIYASPNLVLAGTDSLINSHTFFVVFFIGFLNVLPLVLILVG